MGNRPFFSIIIPTYNRCDNLSFVIQKILAQTYRNFEIVICDNASTDNTEKKCNSFKDKRIRYYRNSHNIGFANNLYRGINLARGKYIFLHGDDDELSSLSVLSNIRKIFISKKIGYLRLKYYYKTNTGRVFDYFTFKKIQNHIPPNLSYIKIVFYIYKTYFQFLTGVIFKNENIKKLGYMENNQKNLQMDGFFIDYLIPLTKKYGAAIDYQNYVIAMWSANKKNVHYYDCLNNECSYEKAWQIVYKYLNQKEKKRWIETETYLATFNLPSLKYYSSNSNLVATTKRLMQLNKKLIRYPVFWIFTVIAFLMPNRLWDIIRQVVLYFKQTNILEKKKN